MLKMREREIDPQIQSKCKKQIEHRVIHQDVIHYTMQDLKYC